MSVLLSIKKMIKGNQKGYINIWMKSSSIKMNNKKTTLLEFHSDEKHFFIFTELTHYFQFKFSPKKVIDFLKERDGSNAILEQILEQKVFYLNGEKISLK